MVDIHYIRQKEPKGLGHAVWCAAQQLDSYQYDIAWK
jgi:UTP-glucose-1-phosphate uridylyltransferase